MIENPSAPPPPTAPAKTQPWVMVVVVIVLLCCLCVGAIGLLIAFGEPILNELGLLHTQLPMSII